ncbi:hypothetical protein AAG906_016231 [Vitis piasezkii]
MFGNQTNLVGQFKPNNNATVWKYLQLKLEESSKFLMEGKSTSVPTTGSTISTIFKLWEILLENKKPSILNSVKELTM